MPIQCKHCENAPCIALCPSNAIKRVDGTVLIEKEKCIGCKVCITACPFGHPRIELGDKDIEISAFGLPKVVQKYKLVKCDGCIDKIENNELPGCYLACPTDAINIENSKIENTAKLMIIKK